MMFLLRWDSQAPTLECSKSTNFWYHLIFHSETDAWWMKGERGTGWREILRRRTGIIVIPRVVRGDTFLLDVALMFTAWKNCTPCRSSSIRGEKFITLSQCHWGGKQGCYWRSLWPRYTHYIISNLGVYLNGKNMSLVMRSPIEMDRVVMTIRRRVQDNVDSCYPHQWHTRFQEQ